MIDTKESTSLVLSKAFQLAPVTVALEKAQGEILQEDLVADRDFPPYNRVAMDGIAVNTHTWGAGKTSFKVVGVQASGSDPLKDCDAKECIEIMTGAALPSQYNAIIRYEDVTIDNGVAVISNPELKSSEFLNVHRQGSDNRAGDPLLKVGTRLGAPEIGIAASIGKLNLLVSQRPKLAIIATGDELIPVENTPLPHQVRISNAYALKAAIEGQGFSHTSLHHIVDSKSELKEKLEKILSECDVMVLSGGVSRGKFDFIPDILETLGVEKVFHKVKQKPGKPLWFGQKLSEGATPKVVFGLPGNPVSAIVNCYKYILPFLGKCIGQASPTRPKVILTSLPKVKKPITNFIPVALDKTLGLSGPASLVKGNGSGDLTSLGNSDGFIEVLPEQEISQKTNYPLTLWEGA